MTDKNPQRDRLANGQFLHETWTSEDLEIMKRMQARYEQEHLDWVKAHPVRYRLSRMQGRVRGKLVGTPLDDVIENTFEHLRMNSPLYNKFNSWLWADDR